MDGASRNAQCLVRKNDGLHFFDRPGQHAMAIQWLSGGAMIRANIVDAYFNTPFAFELNLSADLSTENDQDQFAKLSRRLVYRGQYCCCRQEKYTSFGVWSKSC
jgi:hypothetical protein